MFRDLEREQEVLTGLAAHRSFGADPDVLNRDLVINGHQVTIVGVAPEGFRGTTLGSRPDVYVSITLRGCALLASVASLAVVLLAVVGVYGLLRARALAARREMALRLALGADRSRIVLFGLRNPFWRLRRMLGERRTESGKAYRRAAERHKARRPEVSDD